MSDTPRTDAALKTADALTFVQFARELERDYYKVRGLLLEARAHLEGRPMSQCSRTTERVIEAIKALPPFPPPGPPDPPKPAHHKPFA